jgi:hypothetical protein
MKLLPPPYPLVIKPIINAFLEKEKVFPARSIHKLLWGYEDFFLASLHNLTIVLNEQFKEHKFKFHIPPVNPFVKLQV